MAGYNETDSDAPYVEIFKKTATDFITAKLVEDAKRLFGEQAIRSALAGDEEAQQVIRGAILDG
jgi:hypothetical protein